MVAVLMACMMTQTASSSCVALRVNFSLASGSVCAYHLVFTLLLHYQDSVSIHVYYNNKNYTKTCMKIIYRWQFITAQCSVQYYIAINQQS